MGVGDCVFLEWVSMVQRKTVPVLLIIWVFPVGKRGLRCSMV